MRLINTDGGEVEMSGNGVRCLAAWASRQGIAPAAHTVFTRSGPRPVEIESLPAHRYRIVTGLGPAILRSDLIPMTLDPPREKVLDEPLLVGSETVRVSVTSLGNPHCAVFLDTVADDALVARLGPALERHPAFPVRTNVEFVTVTSRQEIRVRFWERGVGPTLASGTGSGSAAVAAILKGLVDRKARVVCDGAPWRPSGPRAGTSARWARSSCSSKASGWASASRRSGGVQSSGCLVEGGRNGQGEGRDRRVEWLALGGDHLVGAVHRADGRAQRDRSSCTRRTGRGRAPAARRPPPGPSPSPRRRRRR